MATPLYNYSMGSTPSNSAYTAWATKVSQSGFDPNVINAGIRANQAIGAFTQAPLATGFTQASPMYTSPNLPTDAYTPMGNTPVSPAPELTAEPPVPSVMDTPTTTAAESKAIETIAQPKNKSIWSKALTPIKYLIAAVVGFFVRHFFFSGDNSKGLRFETVSNDWLVKDSSAPAVVEAYQGLNDGNISKEPAFLIFQQKNEKGEQIPVVVPKHQLPALDDKNAQATQDRFLYPADRVAKMVTA